MSDIAIRVENLGKRYQLGQSQRYRALRDTLGDVLSAPKRWLRGEKRERPAGDAGTFWALKDVSFEIKPGEVVGIIGRNGAGKSTLLKILSRITEPTEGGVDLYGRVGSLLEVGTGFHPELTGRENIYLNGAILGMKRAEIARKFDEIVAFAEVEQFLDTPVKFYSSGMYMRLAFAVAAHLEPEILVVDEVLAVGDAAFQKKCLGKMGEVARGGRTVLLVSHNMAVVQALCSHVITLKAGALYFDGPLDLAVLKQVSQTEQEEKKAYPIRVFPALELTDFTIAPSTIATSGETDVAITLTGFEDLAINDLCVLVFSELNVRVAIVDLRLPAGPIKIEKHRSLVVSTRLTCVNLIEGHYALGLYVSANSDTSHIYDLASITMEFEPHGNRAAPYARQHRGFVELPRTETRIDLLPRLSAQRF